MTIHGQNHIKFNGNIFSRSGYVRYDLTSYSRLHPWRGASWKGKKFKFANFKTITLTEFAGTSVSGMQIFENLGATLNF
jgi:hypothetical protein